MNRKIRRRKVKKVGAVMTINRDAIKHAEVVYLLTANKAEKYRNGRSYIVYVGRTAKGKSRVATSLAFRAAEVLRQRGLTELHAHLLHGSFTKGQGIERDLEAAVLAAFKMHYGEVPRQNKQGKGSKLKWTDEMERCFGFRRLRSILHEHDKNIVG
jgi:hypothetical protein